MERKSEPTRSELPHLFPMPNPSDLSEGSSHLLLLGPLLRQAPGSLAPTSPVPSWPTSPTPTRAASLEQHLAPFTPPRQPPPISSSHNSSHNPSSHVPSHSHSSRIPSHDPPSPCSPPIDPHSPECRMTSASPFTTVLNAHRLPRPRVLSASLPQLSVLRDPPPLNLMTSPSPDHHAPPLFMRLPPSIGRAPMPPLNIPPTLLKHQLQYRCTYPKCGKPLPSVAALRKHESRHDSNKPFVCEFMGCYKSYTDKSSLTKHRRTHTGERPYECPHPGCGKAFTLAAHLTRHKLIHTGERPHVCTAPGCGKSFVRSDDLRTHTRVHTGERPYTCPFPACMRSFTQASALARHRRTQHALQVPELIMSSMFTP